MQECTLKLSDILQLITLLIGPRRGLFVSARPVDAIGEARMLTDGYMSLRGFSDLDDLIVSAWVVGRWRGSMHSVAGGAGQTGRRPPTHVTSGARRPPI